jgi:hypothetical protein
MKKVLLWLAATVLLFSCDDNDGAFQKISFKIPSFYEMENEHYIFLSDKEGRLIDVAEVQDGSTIELKIPAHITTPVTVNFFRGRIPSNGITRELRAFVDVQPGEYVISEFSGNITTPSGYAITLQNMPENTWVVLSGANKAFSAGADTVIAGSVALFPNGHRPVLACILDETGSSSRYQFLDITENSEVTFDYNSALPLGANDFETPSDDYAVRQSVYKDGVRFPIQDYSQISVKPFPSRPLRLYHSNAFDTHHTYFRILLNNIFYTNDYWGKEIPHSFEMLEASAELTAESDHGFTIVTNGNADVLQTGFNAYEIIEGRTFYEHRTIFIPFNGAVTYKHPQIPESIISRFYPQQNIPHLDGALITNYDTLSYQDFIKFRLELPEYFVDQEKPIKDNARAKSFAF